MIAEPQNLIKTSTHPRDISAAELEVAMAAQPDPELLRRLVELSRDTFGFYTSQFSYTLNYPWVSKHLKHLPKGSYALDIGAGISPIPLFLAERGVMVDCVDNSKHIRTLPVGDDWNEWGFFDYRAIDRKLTSHHCDIGAFTPAVRFDAIYSIAALAHMPRVVRENALQRCYDWLNEQGLLLLTIDIIPSSDFLWNRSEGREVEPPVQHGTIDDVADQLKELGFRIERLSVKRTVYKSRTDLLFIACSKGKLSVSEER